MNPRPPRCERGALPAELLPHLRTGKHSRRFPPALSIRAPRIRAPRTGNAHDAEYCASVLGGGVGNPFETIKFFSALPIMVSSMPPGSGGNALHTRRQRKKYLRWRKQMGGNNVKMRSPLRTESPRVPFAIRRTRMGGNPRQARARAATPAPGTDFLLMEKPFSVYSKPSPRD